MQILFGGISQLNRIVTDTAGLVNGRCSLAGVFVRGFGKLFLSFTPKVLNIKFGFKFTCLVFKQITILGIFKTNL